MNPGDTVEASWWLTGQELPEAVDMAKTKIRYHIAEMCSLKNVMHGAVTFEELSMDNEEVRQFARTHDVPDWVQGPDVRMLRGKAPIVAHYEPESGFTNELDRADLLRLREATRRSYAMHNGGALLTDMECDDIINEYGPGVAVQRLRQG